MHPLPPIRLVHVTFRDGAFYWNTSWADAGRRGPFKTEGDACSNASCAKPFAPCSFRYGYDPAEIRRVTRTA